MKKLVFVLFILGFLSLSVNAQSVTSLSLRINIHDNLDVGGGSLEPLAWLFNLLPGPVVYDGPSPCSSGGGCPACFYCGIGGNGLPVCKRDTNRCPLQE